MNSKSLLTLLLCVPGIALAQQKAKPTGTELEQAVRKLGEVRGEYSDLRRNFYRDINRLDDEALALAKQLRALETEEEQRTAKVKTLEREIEGRKTDFNYSSGVLNQYSKALITRLHPAENQLHTATIEALDQKAASATDDPKSEIMQRAKVLEMGIDRLGAIAGGQVFEGKALKNGSESVEGTLLLAGPSVFFAAKDGSFEGVATFADTGTALPTVVGIKGSSGLIANTLKSGEGPLPLDGTMGKAIEVAAAQESLMDTIKKGGYVGHAILLLGAISFLIAIFKVIEVTRFPVPSRTKINAILDDLLAKDHEAATRKAAALNGPCGDLVQIGVLRFDEKRRVLEEALFEKLVVIKPRLERFLPFLALTAAAGPLMGLLGTVLGIIKTFQAMALYGTGNAKSFSAGISEALITTAEGLIVAIPVLVIHGLLKSLVKGKFGEIEGIAIAMINSTSERERKPEATKSRANSNGEDDDDFELSPVGA
ncbi:MAG: MotA/TolQ/ExbB proton channel family protein [Akkermansiaceae bacterium]